MKVGFFLLKHHVDAAVYKVYLRMLSCVDVDVHSVWPINTCTAMKQSCSSARRGENLTQVAMKVHFMSYFVQACTLKVN